MLRHAANALLRAGTLQGLAGKAVLEEIGVRAGTLQELARRSALVDLSRLDSLSRRLFSDLAPHEQASQPTEYKGPFSTAVGRVKKLSLFSCACALAAGPIIFGLDTSSTLTAKASIAGTLATFGVFTTGLLQWFTGPYVQQLTYRPDTGTVEVTTLNLLAKPRTRRFHLAEVQPADTVHPLSSFTVDGKVYYVDADNFPDKALLAKLAPQQAAAHVVEGAEAQLRNPAAQKQD